MINTRQLQEGTNTNYSILYDCQVESTSLLNPRTLAQGQQYCAYAQGYCGACLKVQEAGIFAQSPLSHLILPFSLACCTTQVLLFQLNYKIERLVQQD